MTISMVILLTLAFGGRAMAVTCSPISGGRPSPLSPGHSAIEAETRGIYRFEEHFPRRSICSQAARACVTPE
jgi:hypothetical protein